MKLGHLRSAWRFRQFIFSAIRGEFQSRYARAKLGLIWFILQPLAQAAIFALVLSKVLGARLGGTDVEGAYAIYLLAGVAAWGLFTEIMNRCLNVFLEYANAMKKIAFPRIALPIIVLGSALVTHLFLLAAVLFVFLFFGHYPDASLLALPLGTAVAASLALGIGVVLGVFNVYLRDVGQIMGVATQLWFWLTPIVYPLNILPEGMQRAVAFNPMTNIAAWYQQILLYGKVPDLSLLLYPSTLAFVFVAISFFVFWRASPELVDAL